MRVQQRPRHCRKGKGGKKKAPASVAAFLRGGIKERVDLHSLNASMITEQRKNNKAVASGFKACAATALRAATVALPPPPPPPPARLAGEGCITHTLSPIRTEIQCLL